MAPTGIRIDKSADLPLIGSFAFQDAPDSGVMPEIHAAYTIHSISAGEDPAMKRAIEIAA